MLFLLLVQARGHFWLKKKKMTIPVIPNLKRYVHKPVGWRHGGVTSASPATSCLSGSLWFTDRWRWAQWAGLILVVVLNAELEFTNWILPYGRSVALLSGGPQGGLWGFSHDMQYSSGGSLGGGIHVNGLWPVKPTQMLHDAFISNRFGSGAFWIQAEALTSCGDATSIVSGAKFVIFMQWWVQTSVTSWTETSSGPKPCPHSAAIG